jgi:hypothetical protein
VKKSTKRMTGPKPGSVRGLLYKVLAGGLGIEPEVKMYRYRQAVQGEGSLYFAAFILQRVYRCKWKMEHDQLY